MYWVWEGVEKMDTEVMALEWDCEGLAVVLWWVEGGGLLMGGVWRWRCRGRGGLWLVYL